jgi:hypothetical protein
MAHTPGPWEMSGPDERPRVQTVRRYVELVADGSRPKKSPRGKPLEPHHKTIHDPNPWGILTESRWSDLGPTTIDNARLIATAPDLLAACKEALKDLSWSAASRSHVERAIDKAEGRS